MSIVNKWISNINKKANKSLKCEFDVGSKEKDIDNDHQRINRNWGIGRISRVWSSFSIRLGTAHS